MPWGIAAAALGIGGALFGASTSSNAAVEAAKIQAQSAQQATQLQRDIFNQTSGNLAPYLGAGTNALGALQTGLGQGPGTAPGTFDPNSPLLQSATSAVGPPPTFPNLPSLNLPTLNLPDFNLPDFNPSGFQQSPGYQWQLGQGIQAAENLGSKSQGTVGGNTLKALQTYGSGLANQDYYNWLQSVYTPGYNSQVQNRTAQYNAQVQNRTAQYNAQVQNNTAQYNAGVQNATLPYNAANNTWMNLINAYNQSQSNQFNRLAGLAGSGQNAAAQQGGFGQAFGAQAGSNTIGAGNALAAGQVGAANAITGGLNSATTNLLSPNTGSNSALGNALAALFGGNTGNIANNYPFAYSINAAQPTAPVYNFQGSGIGQLLMPDTIDPSIPLQAGKPSGPFGPDLKQLITLQSLAQQMQARQMVMDQERQGQNALRQVFGNPDNIDQSTGFPKAAALAPVMQANPELGVNMLKGMSVAQHNQALTQAQQGKLHQDFLKSGYDTMRSMVSAYDSNLKTLGPERAGDLAKEKYNESVDELASSGLYPPKWIEAIKNKAPTVEEARLRANNYVMSDPKVMERAAEGQLKANEPPTPYQTLETSDRARQGRRTAAQEFG